MEARPLMGDSGEGWKCTVDIECIDRSDEFGDEPGTGEENIYWGDYETTLDFSGSEGIFLIENNEVEEKIEISIRVDKDISLEQKGEKLVVKNEEVEVEIDNNLDKLVISEEGNKKEIMDINIGIEEGKPIYKYDEKEKAKLLGFIPVDKNVKKKVDAIDMKMLEEKGPWWEFLSVEEKEKVWERPGDLVGESNPQPSP
jgi:hypothetical protein